MSVLRSVRLRSFSPAVLSLLLVHCALTHVSARNPDGSLVNSDGAQRGEGGVTADGFVSSDARDAMNASDASDGSPAIDAADDTLDVVSTDTLPDDVPVTEGGSLETGPESSIGETGAEPIPDVVVPGPDVVVTMDVVTVDVPAPDVMMMPDIVVPPDVPAMDVVPDVVPDVVRPDVIVPDVVPDVIVPDVPVMDVPVVDVPVVDVPVVDVPARPVRCAEIPGAPGQRVQTLYYGTGLANSWQALCDFPMTGPGWTLVAKVDPTQSAWSYDGARWTDGNLENEMSTNLNRQSAKFRGFTDLTFTQVRVDFSTDTSGLGAYETRSVQFAHNSGTQTLRQIFMTDMTVMTAGTTRDNWLGAIPTVLAVFTPSLEPSCNRIGFNARNGNQSHRVRLGILADDRSDCGNPQSWIGAGGNPTDGVGTTMVAGNRRSTSTMSRRTLSWVYLWLR